MCVLCQGIPLPSPLGQASKCGLPALEPLQVEYPLSRKRRLTSSDAVQHDRHRERRGFDPPYTARTPAVAVSR